MGEEFNVEALKNIELDKICRVCLCKKQSMRPLFGELSLVELLMEITTCKIENTDGWPNQICLQCIHQISRFHTFKIRVEKADASLREYIKGLTVIVEEIPKEVAIAQIELPRETSVVKSHSIQRSEMTSSTLTQPIQPQMIITNTGQIFNSSQSAPQFINTGQVVQGHISHLIQGPDNTVQMITPSGATQLLHIQRASNDRCEIIVQPSVVLQTQEGISTQIDLESDDNNLDDNDSNNYVLAEVQEESVDEEEEIDSESEEKQYLAEFMANQTSCRDNMHICNLCQKEFKHVKWLQSHMKSHSNWIKANCKKLPECKICFKSFRGPGMLKMHMKVHFPKVNKCTICKREFKSKSILYRHRQTHFEKQHVCNICEKAFGTNYQLNQHLARHRGEKSFKCQYCEKAYYNASDLKSHVQSHLGVKIKKTS